VQETIDGIAVDLHEPACLDRRRRLQDLDDLLGICPGLVDVNVEEGKKVSIDCEETDNTPEETHTLRIAHFSVQEYLESDRIRHQKAANFALQYSSAHAEITQICLVYLLEPGVSTGRLDRAKLEEYPLTCFAANFWPHHYKNASDAATHLDDLIMGIFQPQQPALLTWVRITNPDLPYRTQIISALSQTDIASPIYYASFLGLSGVVHKLINNCQGHTDANVNTEGGKYGYPLHAASLKGHDRVVEILLEAGASINARGGILGYPLVAAAVGGYDKVVKGLIKAGAELDVVNEEYDYKIRDGAFEGGRDNFIEMLLSAVLDDNTQTARYSTALQAASHGGHVEVVKTLIAAGANINIQGGRFGNALQSAAHGGHNEVVLILIATGADIKAQGGFYGHALQAASNQGHRDVVLTLIAAGADINAQGGRFGTALQAAAHGRCNAVVKLLIAAGADINAQCGKFGSALGAAVHEGYDEVVETLRAAGADDGVKA
jgi:ankyrin repeat domain-containing protein 50